MKSSAKLGKQTVDNGVERKRLEPIEDSLDLQFPLHFELRGRSAGAFVLSKGAGLKRLRFVFGFECRGIHSTLKSDQQAAVFDALENGLKDMPAGEVMTVHLSSFSSDLARQRQLTRVVEQAPSTTLQFLMQGEKQRVQELTRKGVRKPKDLKIYVTYTIDPQLQDAKDPVETQITRVRNLWNRFTGNHSEAEVARLETLFTKAFTDGFQQWEQFLANKLGLNVRPMDESELWVNLWKRMNQTEAPPLPHVVTFNSRGLSEEIRSELHATSMLVLDKEQMPVADRQWVYVNGRYVAALTFESKPAGWASKNDQLRYLWDLISRDSVTDTEIFCDLQRGNEALIKTNMQRLTKQSIVAADFATGKQSVDVAANLKVKRAVAAQEQLYEGCVPLYTACLILVHRKSLDRLDEACRYLKSCIRLPAAIDREIEYAWKMWLQTLPISWDSMLVAPFNRRLTYLNGEAPAFLPLVRPQLADGSGLELLSEEGGVPIHLDLFTKHRNIGIWATTRAGKSVMMASIFTQALALSIPIVILDFPTDTASTFRDYCRFLGKKQAAYFDIRTESNNLFETPDLRTLPLKEQQDRMGNYVSFLESALMTMIMGGSVASTAELLMLRKTVRALIAMLLNKFFADPSIQARYKAAHTAGFGSPEWQQMPTLADFLPFCDLGQIEVEAESLGRTKSAMEQIQVQLRFWLTSSVGRSISAPSSFRTDSPLLVFALRNLNDGEDAAILALSAYSAALRRALSSPVSIFCIDESPILFEFDEISALVGRLCANGAKAGVRVMLSAQDPDTIAKSPSASKILQNLNTRLVGRIQPTAVPSFVKWMQYPEEVIARNSTEAFFPKAEGVYSQWLLDDNGTYTYCRFYSAYQQLAAVANNPHEQKARNAYLAAYPNRYEALAKFTEALIEAMRANSIDIRLPAA